MNKLLNWLKRKEAIHAKLTPQPDRISEQVSKAASEHKLASSRALDTIRDMLQENDRLHNRPR
mgnify:CR=1 FL=1